MTEEYKFTVTSREIKFHSNNIDENINIQISEDRLHPINLYFSLKFDKSKNCILVEKISIKHDTDEQYREIIGCLRGYFYFTDERETLELLEFLSKLLNREQMHFGITNAKWNNLCEQFRNWFDSKLKVYLQKELELHKMYMD